jgi:uncharacterized membrane protein
VGGWQAVEWHYFHAMPDTTLFLAEIVPHRSLSAAGLRRLLIGICALCGASAAVFVWLGAWPELVMLSTSGLRVVRTDPRGRRRELTLSPAWLNLSLEERPGRVPALVLAERHRRMEIGQSLGEDEKRDLAQALGEALHRLRNPVFDNPQLREPV